MVISVIVCTTCRPCSRHHRNSSPFVIGTRIPEPWKASAARDQRLDVGVALTHGVAGKTQVARVAADPAVVLDD